VISGCVGGLHRAIYF